MSFVDTKYIGLVSVRLQKFSKKKEGLYTFRCPYCGDSQKNKNKTRGYLYKLKNDHNFKCHNCGLSRTFTNFLKDQDVVLYDEYVMERYKSGLTGRLSNTPNPVMPSSKPKFVKKSFDLPRISELNKTHPARTYLSNRRIPEDSFKDLYYCDHFRKWTNEQKYTFEDSKFDESRIVIPLRTRDKIFGFQGRSLDPKNQLRYITIMLDDDSPKVYGLDRINENKKIYVVEGPLDSLFVENCVAMVGADLDLRTFGWSNYIYVYDNEPRNREIIERIDKTISRGDQVVIWPNTIKEKDINDMTMGGHNVKDLLESNTYSGLEAKLKFTTWKKI